jgi:hypothetical protein
MPFSSIQPGIALTQDQHHHHHFGEQRGPNNTPFASQKLVEFLEKYDLPMSEHRAMMRTMYLDNILYNTARLHKHNWTLLSQNEKCKECSYLTILDSYSTDA